MAQPLELAAQPARLPPQPLPASAPCAADGWDPCVIPELGPSPPRTPSPPPPSPSGARLLVRGLHAKESTRAI
jgi:hypothetical protein